MKVLFLSHYKTDDTMGFYAQSLMLAMHKAGIDIVFRHIDNGKDASVKLHPLLLPIEDEPLSHCTHCIQFLKSEYTLGTKKFDKNIAIVLEPGKNSNNLSIMDEVWVFNDKTRIEVEKFISSSKIRTISPVLNNIKNKLEFVYSNGGDVNFEDFTIDSVGQKIKELLSA